LRPVFEYLLSWAAESGQPTAMAIRLAFSRAELGGGQEREGEKI